MDLRMNETNKSAAITNKWPNQYHACVSEEKHQENVFATGQENEHYYEIAYQFKVN